MTGASESRLDIDRLLVQGLGLACSPCSPGWPAPETRDSRTGTTTGSCRTFASFRSSWLRGGQPSTGAAWASLWPVGVKSAAVATQLWSLLGDVMIEVPVIPMTAPTHTPVSNLSQPSQTAVSCSRGEWTWRWRCTGRPRSSLSAADCVTETTSALGLSARPAQPVSLVPLDESFGRVRERYERTIEMIAPENEAPAVCLRRAPFTNWHRPTGIGVHAIGSSESGVRGAIPPEHQARPDFVGSR